MKHKDGADEHVVDSVVNPGMSHESEQEQSDMQIDPPRDADYEPSDVFAETADESLFLKKLALFPPPSFKQLSKIFRKYMTHLLFKLKEKLVTLGVKL